MDVPVLDLRRQYQSVKAEVDAAIMEVIESQKFILGPVVESIEKEIAEYCGTKHAVGVSSGTDALLIALMALQVGPGDEVITTSFSFFATVGSIARLGASPVFVDIDPETFNLDVQQVKEEIRDRTKVILPVHLYGQCADMDPILELTRNREIYVVEDAAQAIAAEYNGKRAGALGDIGCFSFYPTKNLNAFGDAGMVTTNDDQIADKVRTLRVHGAKQKYLSTLVGMNARLDAIQAAVLRVKLKYLNQWTARRREIAAFYDANITADGIVLPSVHASNKHVYHQYVIRAPRRDELASKLSEAGVGTMIYYPYPLHLQQCFKHLGHQEGDFPESERASKEVLALPIFPEITQQELSYVAECVNKFALS